MFEFLGVPPQALFGQLLLGLINGAFYAMLSLGLAVIFGMLNVINFALGAAGDGYARAAITIDREIDDDQLALLRATPGVFSIQQV